jgi:hypothetical protein
MGSTIRIRFRLFSFFSFSFSRPNALSLPRLFFSLFPIEGNYVCIGYELGSGSFSQVYKGYRKSDNLSVAIKVVDLQSLNTEKAKQYHERERQILSSMKHKNIAQLYDILVRPLSPFLLFLFLLFSNTF